jgi:hypothetical protein
MAGMGGEGGNHAAAASGEWIVDLLESIHLIG